MSHRNWKACLQTEHTIMVSLAQVSPHLSMYFLKTQEPRGHESSAVLICTVTSTCVTQVSSVWRQSRFKATTKQLSACCRADHKLQAYNVACGVSRLAQDLPTASSVGAATCLTINPYSQLPVHVGHDYVYKLRERERLQCFSQPTSLIAYRRRNKVTVSGSQDNPRQI